MDPDLNLWQDGNSLWIRSLLGTFGMVYNRQAFVMIIRTRWRHDHQQRIVSQILIDHPRHRSVQEWVVRFENQTGIVLIEDIQQKIMCQN